MVGRREKSRKIAQDGLGGSMPRCCSHGFDDLEVCLRMLKKVERSGLSIDGRRSEDNAWHLNHGYKGARRSNDKERRPGFG
jgi:hypothetical protein